MIDITDERLIAAAVNCFATGVEDLPKAISGKLSLWQKQAREFARLRQAIIDVQADSAVRIDLIRKKIEDAKKLCQHPVREYSRMDAQSHPTNVCVICGHDSEESQRIRGDRHSGVGYDG